MVAGWLVAGGWVTAGWLVAGWLRVRTLVSTYIHITLPVTPLAGVETNGLNADRQTNTHTHTHKQTDR